ncbi:MAG TPA: DUF262 domain-containing HNH endonuclease family protein [Polyangiaceae bacterium]|nr:DUF262 domain-containing HNH endonuclease family protein [Polyangiaceae bacterium]
MDIQPQLLTLHKLLNGRLFRIPQYQRAYSWASEHRADLFKDIEKVFARPGSSHFMATIVGLRRGNRLIGTDEFHIVDVVDGQQRLTTLVILLKAIQQASTKSAGDAAIGAELGALLVKVDEVAPVLLQTNHDTSAHCLTYLRKGTHPAPETATTSADHRLLGAMRDCEHFVAQWLESGRRLGELLALLKNRLQFILHEITDEALVYTVFEVLNSRGLDVSHFDRLKSALMGAAFEAKTGNAEETIHELHGIWREIYAAVGLRPGVSTEALKFAATLRVAERPNRPLGEEEAVHVLRRIAGNTTKGVVEVCQWILTVTKAVAALRADRRLHGVTDIAQARLLAVAILLRDDLDQGERDALRAAWEKVSFRIYGMFGKDARTKVGDYVRHAWWCAHDRPPAKDVLGGIIGIGSDHPIGAAINNLRNENCYDAWQSELRYMLFRYEEHLAKERGQKFDNEQWARIWATTAAESIEHVYPQSKGTATQTPTGIFVHRLGNLTLLPPGLNSKLGAKDPTNKKDEYLKTGLAIAVDVAERIPTWDRAAVEKREEEILAWAALEWAD